MLIRVLLSRHWTIPAIFLTIFFVYFILISLSLNQPLKKSPNYSGSIKTIVAYSLLKQIEIESEEYKCELQLTDNSSTDNVNRTSTIQADGDCWTRIEDSNIFVSSVNLDQRLNPYNYIRIIAVVKGTIATVPFCQILTRSGNYHFIRTTVTPIWSKNWNEDDNSTYYNPILLSCKLPLQEDITSIGLTQFPCKISTNINFPVLQTKNETKKFITVCVKPLDFSEDISLRLIQWIEIIRILGADKIDIYIRKVVPKVLQILKWYSRKLGGQITIKRFATLPPIYNSTEFRQTLWQKRRYEIVAYNNCFYRNQIESNYIVPLDIDEIIVPKQANNWKMFLKQINSRDIERKYASFTVPNTYYFTKSQDHRSSLFFLHNILRSDYSPDGESGKSFIVSKNTLTVFNHYALHTLKPYNLRVYFLPSSYVQLNHYKKSCNPAILIECVKYSPKIQDPVMINFQEKFLEQYKKRLSELKRINILL